MQSSTALSFMNFCVRKLLFSTVVFKLIINYKVFSTKLDANKMFGLREFRTIFKVVPKSICRALP